MTTAKMTVVDGSGAPMAPAGRDLKRLLQQHLADVLAALGNAEALGAHAIHKARRRLKRVKTLFRLLRPVLPEERGQGVDAVRSASALLSQSRDCDAMLDKARWLLTRAEPMETGIFADLVAQLEHEAAAARVEALPIARIKALLTSAEAEVALLDDRFDGPGLIHDGLIEAYRRGRHFYRQAVEGADADLLHEWRKQVKHRLHISQMLEDRCPVANGRVVADLDRLAEYLGDGNDLANLRLWLKQNPSALGGRKQRDCVTDRIDARRRKLAKRAIELGEELYGDRTRHFTASAAGVLAARSPV